MFGSAPIITNTLPTRRVSLAPVLRLVHVTDRVELGLIRLEREYVNRLLRNGRINDEIRRRIERELDLREEAIRGLNAGSKTTR